MISQPCSYVQDNYGVPACIGRRVIAYGKPGIILADRGHYIGVALDDDKRVYIGNYHPIDGIEYGEMADKLPKRPRKSNYDKFCDDDCGYDFNEWLGINKPVYQQRKRDISIIEFRMVRYPRSCHWRPEADHGVYVEVAGDWSSTKPEAKLNYKTALYEYLARQRADAKAGIY